MKPIIHKYRRLSFNVFDALVVGLMVLALLSFVWLRVSRKTEWITLRLVVANDEWWWEGAPPQWWYVDGLQAGQTAKNALGETVAEIVNVQSFDVGAYRRRAFVDIKVKGAHDTRRQVFLYNYQPLQIGKSLDLTFGKNNVRGIITYIDNLPQDFKEKTIEVKLAAVHPWVTSSFYPGLKMTDSQGHPLASILSVDVVPSSVKEVVEIHENKEIKFPPALFQDVTLRVKIKTFHSGGVDYFVDRAAIKIGERIWFQFPQTLVRDAEITRIIEE